MTIVMSPIRWAFVGVIVLAILVVVYAAWPTKPPAIDTAALIKDATAKVEAQFKQDIAEKQVAINDYKSRLAVSEAKYKTLTMKYNELQKGKDSVTKPETNQELRDRFTALGYAPLPVN